LAVPIDNDIYNRLGETWWDETNPLNMLHGSVTPARIAYFRERLSGAGLDPQGWNVLDIGCGGGFMAEEFARLGCVVTGVDPSEVSINTARRHAADADLDIDYLVSAGESLPLPDASFDLVYCCDVLEHVADLDRVIGETARVMKPGGVYLYDTVNRTRMSKLIAIKLMQDWSFTRVFDTPGHVWEMFIRPEELVTLFERHGLRSVDMVGLGPRTKNPLVVLDVRRARTGRLSYAELSRRLRFGQVKSLSSSYMGMATKDPAA
jgi:2-polyprenyl-6-hydroxyphenyl methylase/3-demethylubiquinone-9 3-methyltransferase